MPFELSAWNRQQLPLGEWLAAELSRQYGSGSSLAKRWVNNDATTFLLHAVDRVLMIRQGGSFRFIHRMLLEHLAAQASSARNA